MCHACGKTGHLAKVCCSSWISKSTSTKGKPPTDKLKRNNWIDSLTEEAEPFPDDGVLKVQGHSTRPITVTLELNGKSVVTEVDTGAAVSLMSLKQHRRSCSLIYSSRRPQLSFTLIQQSPCQWLARWIYKLGMLIMWESTHCLLLVGMAIHYLGGTGSCTSDWTGQAFVWQLFKTTPSP